MICLNSARFNMRADIIRQERLESGSVPGTFRNTQDPITGEIIRVWVPGVDDVGTPTIDESLIDKGVHCLARGIIDGGIRVAGTTERWGKEYENIDYVKMTLSSSINIGKRDRVTNISNAKGLLIWKEEEFSNAATIFEVLGSTPIVDPFGNYVEQQVLLARADVQ